MSTKPDKQTITTDVDSELKEMVERNAWKNTDIVSAALACFFSLDYPEQGVLIRRLQEYRDRGELIRNLVMTERSEGEGPPGDLARLAGRPQNPQSNRKDSGQAG